MGIVLFVIAVMVFLLGLIAMLVPATVNGQDYKNIIIMYFVPSLVLFVIAGLLSDFVLSRGEFKVISYESSYSSEYKGKFLKYGEQVANDLSNIFKLPSKNIYIQFMDCQEKNAFYIPSESKIVMCYELYSELSFILKDEKSSLSAFNFILMHELGHALVHQFNLPIVGKEEDAVDSIATTLLLEKNFLSNQDNAKGIIYASLYFSNIEKNNKKIAWGDSHSIGLQRTLNLICWAGGANKSIVYETKANNLYDHVNTSNRHCAEEYKKNKISTYQILTHYLK